VGLKGLKSYTERLLEPVSGLLSKLGLTPNHISLAGTAASALSGILYYSGNFRIAGVILALSGLCDLLDGNMARTQGKTSSFGAFLDSTVDRYSDMFVLFGILGYSFKHSETALFFLTLAALMGSIMVSYTRARAECIIERCDVGIMERPDRVVVLILFSLIDRVDLAVAIIAVLANITAIQRILYTKKRLEEKDVDNI